MNCSQAQAALSAYIDRQLPEWEKTAVVAHADHCEECKTEMNALLQLKRTLRSHSLPSLPTSVRTAIQEETYLKTARWKERWTMRWWIPPLAVAAAIGGWLMTREAKSPDKQAIEALIATTPTPAVPDNVVAATSKPRKEPS